MGCRISSYLSSPHFDQFAKLKSRKSLLRSTEKSYHSASLRPSNGTVRLHDNTLVTVPVFDAKQMILSLLLDSSLMNKLNIVEGYNAWTGLVKGNILANDKYGEVHTGDAWLTARNRYCQQENEMPVALIVFADKSHTDLHGAPSRMPIIFTLTLFNRAARCNSRFRRPFRYLPNYGYGKGTTDETVTRDKIQDEHNCISFAFQSLIQIHKDNGFDCVVLGRDIRVKVWIHFFIGDTEENNKWLGQYRGNRESVKCHDLSNPSPQSRVYVSNNG